jgi:hypothetical protein
MPTARDWPALAFKNGSLVLLARVVGVDGQPLVRSQVSAASYTLSQLDPQDPDHESPVVGHTARPLLVADILFDSLQRDAAWEYDQLGYNFRHLLDVAAQPAFAAAGQAYRLRYELAVPGSQPVLVRFKIKAI